MNKDLKIIEPRFSYDLEKYDNSFIPFEEDTVSNKIFESITFENINYEYKDFSGCIFKNCVFKNVKLGKFTFEDIIFENCDLSNTSFNESK